MNLPDENPHKIMLFWDTINCQCSEVPVRRPDSYKYKLSLYCKCNYVVFLKYLKDFS